LRATHADARRLLAGRILERQLCLADPIRLMSHMTGVDQRTGERFDFTHLREPLEPGEVTFNPVYETSLRPRDATWRWQRYIADRLEDQIRLIFLKGRQIGVTWIVLGYDVAEAIVKPGTTSLLFRQGEADAIDNVRRWYTLYQSLPAYLREGIKVIRPDRGVLPGRDGVALQFGSGEISDVIPMSSAKASGHGRSVRHVNTDEGAYIDLLEQIMAAVEPAAGNARITIVSTANGRSNEETGEGNEFHRRWEDLDSGYERIFLAYDVHPDRDEEWYATAPEVRALKPHQRTAQFPRNPDEAFALSSRVYFDPEDLEHYRNLAPKPLHRLDFIQVRESNGHLKGAKLEKHRRGNTTIYVEPKPDVSYAIAADVATGRGLDYSAATVIDLSTMEIAADFHGKIEADLYATQLHYLGRYYNSALLAIETQGGFGEAIIIALRDGKEGRIAYPKLYRHVLRARPDLPMTKPFGWPTNQRTRPQMLNQLEKAIRPDDNGDRALPWLPAGTITEMGDFIHHDHGTSPRARTGARDDRVMATAIALELYRIYGVHANARKHRKRTRPRPLPYPWMRDTRAGRGDYEA